MPDITSKIEMTSRKRPGRRPQTHCNKGHEYTLENTWYEGDSRYCRLCRTAYLKDYYAKKQAKFRSENPLQPRVYTRKIKPVVESVRNTNYDLLPRDIKRIGAILDTIDRSNRKSCWRWPKQLNTDGYGFTRVYRDGKRKNIMAHRVAYEMVHGPIPLGLTIDHVCRNHACVNPDHLEPVTTAENTRRGTGWMLPEWDNPSKKKTHCPKGHPYDEANTSVYIKKNGYFNRRCKTCMRDRARLSQGYLGIRKRRNIPTKDFNQSGAGR